MAPRANEWAVDTSLRRVLGWVAVVLLGTVWTVSSYLESRQPHRTVGAWTVDAERSAGGSAEGARRAGRIEHVAQPAASSPRSARSTG